MRNRIVSSVCVLFFLFMAVSCATEEDKALQRHIERYVGYSPVDNYDVFRAQLKSAEKNDNELHDFLISILDEMKIRHGGDWTCESWSLNQWYTDDFLRSRNDVRIWLDEDRQCSANVHRFNIGDIIYYKAQYLISKGVKCDDVMDRMCEVYEHQDHRNCSQGVMSYLMHMNVEKRRAKENERIARLKQADDVENLVELGKIYKNGIRYDVRVNFFTDDSVAYEKNRISPWVNEVIVPKNEQEAEAYLKKAVDLGSADAVLELLNGYNGETYPSQEQISLMNKIVRFPDKDKRKCSDDLAVGIAYLLNARVLSPAGGDKDRECRDWFILAGELSGGESGVDDVRKHLAEIDKLEKSVRESSFKHGNAFETLMEKYADFGYFDRLYRSVSNITDTGIGCYYMAFIKANGITSDGKYNNDGDIYTAADYFHNARYYEYKKAIKLVNDSFNSWEGYEDHGDLYYARKLKMRE